MTVIGTVVVKIQGDITNLVANLEKGGLHVTGFEKKVERIGRGGGAAVTSQARGFSNLARAFTNAAGQSGVLNSEISILASSVGNVGLRAAGAGIGLGLLVGGLGFATKNAIGFESAIVKVAKTANFSAEETKAFGDEILEMSRRLPVATQGLIDIAVVAGQLGIQGAGNIATFTEEIAKLASTTGVAPADLATGLGTIIQIFGLAADKTKNLSAELTALGNEYNSTEQAILDGSVRLAGVGAALDIPVSSVLATANAIASVMPDIEAGTSAVQRGWLELDEVVSEGGDKLALYADIAGLTVDEFKKLATTRVDLAFAAFIDGLGGINNAREALIALEITDVRMTRTFLSLANSSRDFGEQLQFGAEEAVKAKATNTEFARSVDTTSAQFQLLKNNINATAIEIGNTFNPAVREAITGLNAFVGTIPVALQNLRANLHEAGEALVTVGDKAVDLFAVLAEGWDTSAVSAFAGSLDGVTAAFGRVGGAINNLPSLPGWLGAGAALFGGGPFGPGLAALNLLTGRGSGGGGDKERKRSLTEAGGAAAFGLQAEQDAQNARSDAAAAAKRDAAIPPGLQGGGSGGAAGLTVLSAISDGIITLTEALTLGLSDAEVIALELAAAEGKVADEQYRARIGLQAIAKAYPGLNGEQIKFRLGLAAIAEHLRKTGETVQKFILDTSTAALEGFRSAFDAIFNRPTKETIGLQLQRDELQRKKLLLERGGAADDDPRIKAFEAKIAAIQRELEIRRIDVDITKARGALADQTTPNDQDVATQAALLTTAIGIQSAEVEKYTGIVYLQEAATINLTIAANNAAAALNSVGGTEYNPQQKAFINVVALNKGEPAPFPGYAQGTPYVPRTGLAMLHKGEAVIPAPSNRGESGAPINMQTYITADSEASEAAMRRLAKMVVEEQASRLRLAGFAGGSVNSHAFTPGGLR